MGKGRCLLLLELILHHPERANGTVEPLGSTATVELCAGDAFIIETPGGGGFGKA